MESSKLKNILIIILLVTNLLLLTVVAAQRLQSRQARQKTLANAVSLLAERGVSVAPEVLELPDFPAVLPLERSGTAEEAAFAAVLGGEPESTRRGLVTYYVGPQGQGEARDDGTFSVEFSAGLRPSGEETREEQALAVLEKMGYTGLVTGSTEHTLTVTQCCISGKEKLPIYACAAALTYEDGALTSIRGRRTPGQLPSQTPVTQEEKPLSLATLLLRFRAGILDRGDACTAVTAASRGYTLASAGGLWSLTPVLRLTTDTQIYHLDALTGEFLVL